MQQEPFAPFRIRTQGLAETSNRGVSVETVLESVGSIESTLILARVLAESGRRIDLEGLDVQMSVLCNQALALPEEQGRAVRPAMILLRDALDQLNGVLVLQEPRPARLS